MRIRDVRIKDPRTNSFICAQFSLDGEKIPITIVMFGKNNRIIMIAADTVHTFTFVSLLCTSQTPLLIPRNPLLRKFVTRASSFNYFQPTSLKIKIDFALLSPRTDNEISCSLNSPHDLSNSVSSTDSFTGYS